jgi:hypothetical protein
VKVGDLVRILRSDIHGTIGMIVRANVRRGYHPVHTVEMYGSDWSWSTPGTHYPRVAFVEGDLELISG